VKRFMSIAFSHSHEDILVLSIAYAIGFPIFLSPPAAAREK